MIVRRLDEPGSGTTIVEGTTWTSRRLLLADDRMGFSLHDTLMHAGTETRMCYRHHFEAVYCVSGRGSVESLESGERHAIAPGTMYALDRHDAHILRADTELRLICVFNPAVVGAEVHDETGAYPAPVERRNQ